MACLLGALEYFYEDLAESIEGLPSCMHEILAMSKKSIFYASSHEKTRNKTIRMQIGEAAKDQFGPIEEGLKK